MKELVSVIMPAYNAGKYIAQSILSVIHQSYENWELIIVNDGSTDDTEGVILKYVNTYKDRIFLYRNEKNSGAAATLNKAMSHAKGKYMCWLSADDLYFETMIESQVQFLEENKQFEAVFSKSVAIDEKNNLISVWEPKELIDDLQSEKPVQPYFNLLMLGNTFHGCSILGLRDNFLKTGEFDTQFPYATDYEYWVRMAAVTKIGYVDEFNVMGREYPEQTSKLGRNDVDAIRAFCGLVHNEEVMRPLFEKIGQEYSKETIKTCFIYRMYGYKGSNKELAALLQGFHEYVKDLIDGVDE